MKLIVLAVFALAAAARADFHDNVFHFSTLRSPVGLAGLAYRQQPAYTGIQPAAYVAQYTPALAYPNVLRQPAVYTSQVPLAATYSALGGAAYGHAYSDGQARILKHAQEVDSDGPYRAHYVTENGISVSEEGSLTGAGPEGPAVAKRGSYSYTGPDGVQYTVNWVADEYGYRAAGAHLPTAPLP